MSTEYDGRGHDHRHDHTDRDRPHRHGGNRALAVGVAGFVAVHLLAILVLDEPSLPALVGVEGLAVAALVGGDVVTTRDVREAALVAVGVISVLGAVGLALDTLDPWVVAVGLLAVASGTLYVAQLYDRSASGGEPS